jgi:DNA polymerase-3 subunit chi
MTVVDFYVNAADRERLACRLAAKAAAQGRRILVLAPDPGLAARLDRLMWTWPPTAFLPHCLASEPLAAETPVLIALDAEPPSGCPVLLNLGAECPPQLDRYERVLEVVGADEEERRRGRARYAAYRERGYPIRTHDLAGKSLA